MKGLAQVQEGSFATKWLQKCTYFARIMSEKEHDDISRVVIFPPCLPYSRFFFCFFWRANWPFRKFFKYTCKQSAREKYLCKHSAKLSMRYQKSVKKFETPLLPNQLSLDMTFLVERLAVVCLDSKTFMISFFALMW